MDPTTGMFLSVDPLVSSTGQAYLYGAGNPTTYADPTGLGPEQMGPCGEPCQTSGRRPGNGDATGSGSGGSPTTSTSDAGLLAFQLPPTAVPWWVVVGGGAATAARTVAKPAAAVLASPYAAAAVVVVGGVTLFPDQAGPDQDTEERCASKPTSCLVFHRIVTPSQPAEDIALIRESGILRGYEYPGRSVLKVRAFIGPLPPGESGFEFTTEVVPTAMNVPYGKPGRLGADWKPPSPGIGEGYDPLRDENYAYIPIRVTKVQDPAG
jgi:hypothetical protein